MDRWFEPPLRQRGVRRDLRKYVLSSPEVGAALRDPAALERFDRPALVAWASEDQLMPREHGRRLAEVLPQGELAEIEDSRTLIPEDQPGVLAGHLRALLAR
jgi:pimeloyl-ACP methyl ester carboxylesterase